MLDQLCVVIFDEPTDIFASSVNKEVHRDFADYFKDDHDEDCPELPMFCPKPFYKKLIWWFEYKGCSYVFCSSRLAQHELGRIEHCIYTLTGKRGVGNHINKLEFLATPNTPMKKFLLKRC